MSDLFVSCPSLEAYVTMDVEDRRVPLGFHNIIILLSSIHVRVLASGLGNELNLLSPKIQNLKDVNDDVSAS